MAQFATHDDLAARLGVTFSTAEQTRADTLLTLASGLIQKEARQNIAYVANDVLTIPGTTDEQVRLPERPVVSVASVTLNGVAMVLGTDYVRVSDLLVRLNSTVVGQNQFYVLYPNQGWGDPSQTLVVTYSHGYQTVPDAIRAICLEACVRVWVNPGNVVRERMGPEETQYTPTTRAASAGGFAIVGMMLQADEVRIIRDICRRTMGSTALQ